MKKLDVSLWLTIESLTIAEKTLDSCLCLHGTTSKYGSDGAVNEQQVSLVMAWYTCLAGGGNKKPAKTRLTGIIFSRG